MEQVVIGDLFTGLFEAIGQRPGSAKGVQAALKLQIGELLPNPMNQLGFTALVTG